MTMASSTDEGRSTPIWIQPLSRKSAQSEQDGVYHVIQKILTPSPIAHLKDAEIETSLEEFVDATGKCQWRRVAVRSGPVCTQQVIHASFMIPNHYSGSRGAISSEEAAPQNLLCWAAFPERPQHKLLCVLVSPTVLTIWDVYPAGDQAYVSGEGQSISLPFQCASIHALGTSLGLLLQRQDDPEDLQSYEMQRRQQHSSWTSHMEEDDGFFLKVPSLPTDAVATSIAGSRSPTSPHSQMVPPLVTSLFSLSHPLEDVLPLASGDNLATVILTDVFEKVIFTDTVTWTDHKDGYLEKVEYEQPICVTFHTLKKRHAVWSLKRATTPPPSAPLWQRTRQWRSPKAWSLEDQNSDMELLGVVDPDDRNSRPTHDQALADALGVRRTPRNPSSTKCGRNSLEPRSSRRETPRNQSRGIRDIFAGEETGGLHMLSLRPLSNLHPSVSIFNLFEESVEAKRGSACASNIFLASDYEGSGLLTLALVCAPNEQTKVKDLRLFAFRPTTDPNLTNEMAMQDGPTSDKRHVSLKVETLSSLHCLAAQPVQSTKKPLCFCPHTRNKQIDNARLATDILVLQSDAVQTMGAYMTLYRVNLPIAKCALPADTMGGSHFSISDILNPVADRLDITMESSLGVRFILRSKVSLIGSSSKVAEKVLSAIDSAFFKKAVEESKLEFVEFALRLRADCKKVESSMSKIGISLDDVIVDDKAWSAVQSVLMAFFGDDLLGHSSPAAQRSDTRSSSNESKSPWEALVASAFHSDYQWDNCDAMLLAPLGEGFDGLPIPKSYSNVMLAGKIVESVHCSCIGFLPRTLNASAVLFDTLHFVYEDMKLTGSMEELRKVSTPLVHACLAMEEAGGASTDEVLNKYIEHYTRDLGPDLVSKMEAANNDFPLGQSQIGIMTSNENPPCFFSWLDQMMKDRSSANFYSSITAEEFNAECHTTRSLLRVFSLMFGSQESCTLASDHVIVKALIEEGISDSFYIRDELPVGVSLPILEVIRRCREDHMLSNSVEWTAKELALVGRQDLCNPASVLAYPDANGKPSNILSDSAFEDKDNDGLVPLQLWASNLFPADNRIREAGRLLRSSKPMRLYVPRGIEVSDHEYERMKQSKLLLLSRRALALPVGRGMTTIGNFRLVPAEPLPIPDFCLVGRVPPTNATVALDVSECPPDMRVWPEFHNGVAAGLRLPKKGNLKENIARITRTWIVYNRPNGDNQNQPINANNSANPTAPDQSHAHGGLLFALGLRGHLKELEMTDVYDYLTQGSVTTTAGVLLGMACSKRGSCDISVSKMICLHIPSLIPQHFSAIDVASPVQTAAVAGAGLLFQSSSHRMMTEFLLNEIGRRPESDVSALDREAYTLACGISLGMVNLCQGEKLSSDETMAGGSAGLSDLRIVERLHRYIIGGIDGEEKHRIREANDRHNLPSSSSSGENEKCSCVFEGDSINIDITAPAATLALGLIFMKSGNKTIASSISLPETHFLLEYVRPDFLGIRVVSRALILWDDVQPTRQWIDAQLPAVVKNAYSEMQATVKRATQLGGMLGAAENSVQTQFHGSTEVENAMHDGHGSDSRKTAEINSPQYHEYDRQVVRQMYVHVVAGACFGMGLRYAGTGDERAAAAISDCILELQAQRDGNDSGSVAMRPEDQILETCLGCAAISLALVLAGTGDLNALRLLKILRWKCDEDVKYGSHMAYAMAIGLLFLGGGTCTLGRDPEDIAVLVAAFFPRFPLTTADNQYHLQALRHLYVLAVKRQDISFIDVDTNESVPMPIEVRFHESKTPLHLTAPCLVPNTDTKILEIKVLSSNFYPITVEMKKLVFGRRVGVKRKVVNRLHSNALRQSLLLQAGSSGGPLHSLIKVATSDRSMLAFAEHICDTGYLADNTKLPLTYRGESDPAVAEFCSSALLECLASDVKEAFSIYLCLRTSIDAVDSLSTSSPRFTWDLRLVRTYYEGEYHILSAERQPMLKFERVSYLLEMMERVFEKNGLHKMSPSLFDIRKGHSRVVGSAQVFHGLTSSPSSFGKAN